MEDLSFEEALELLEQTIHDLEAGDLALANALALFERGTRLAARCDHLLDEAELRVRQITVDSPSRDEAVSLAAWSADTPQ